MHIDNATGSSVSKVVRCGARSIFYGIIMGENTTDILFIRCPTYCVRKQASEKSSVFIDLMAHRSTETCHRFAQAYVLRVNRYVRQHFMLAL